MGRLRSAAVRTVSPAKDTQPATVGWHAHFERDLYGKVGNDIVGLHG